MNIWQSAARIAMIVMLGIGIYGQTALAEEVYLEKDTDFYLQGHSVGEPIEFRKGTTVVLNDIGEVVEGTLNEEAWLRPVGWQSIIQDYSYAAAYIAARPFFPRLTNSSQQAVMMTFGHLPYKEKTRIVIDENGYVLSGTVKDDVTIGLIEGRYGFVELKGGAVITFYPDGKLRSGTLDEDTRLRPVGWQNRFELDRTNAGYITFRAGDAVEFNEQGEVLVGTIQEASPTLIDDTGKMYSAGTELLFDANSVTQSAKALEIKKPLKFGF